jgi:hypothetical protein
MLTRWYLHESKFCNGFCDLHESKFYFLKCFFWRYKILQSYIVILKNERWFHMNWIYPTLSIVVSIDCIVSGCMTLTKQLFSKAARKSHPWPCTKIYKIFWLQVAIFSRGLTQVNSFDTGTFNEALFFCITSKTEPHHHYTGAQTCTKSGQIR